MKREIERQLKLIKFRTEEIIPEAELRVKLERSIKENIPLKIKFGIDPTGSEIHLGHALPLRKLKQFQELGHSIEFIIGSFTAKIGDPTNKNEARKMLSDEEVTKNSVTYLDQASQILDISKMNIHYNHEWLSKLTFEDLVHIMAKFSLSVMISREDFANRLKNNQPISLVELSYPLMQGYDSVYLKADIEIGGTDQKFNLLRARDLQKAFGQEPQVCLTLPILEGLSGKDKMSKSLNNYIGVNEDPNNMFGKIMSIPDNLINKYFKFITELSEEELHKIEDFINSKPYDAKKMLASEVVKLYHSNEIALAAAKHFHKLFSQKEEVENVEQIKVQGRSLIEIISESAKISKTHAKRLLNDGAVKLNGLILNENSNISNGFLRIGKKLAFKIDEK